MDVNKIFVGGKMEKDADERYVPNGAYRDANNIRVLNSAASDAGAVENVQGNKIISSLGLTNASCVGALSDEQNQKIYWWLISDEYQGILEYDKPTGNIVWVLQVSAS